MSSDRPLMIHFVPFLSSWKFHYGTELLTPTGKNVLLVHSNSAFSQTFLHCSTNKVISFVELMFYFIITIYYCRYYCVVHAELSVRIDVHMFRVDCVQPGRTLLAPAITVRHVPALLWNPQLQGALLCQWLPADWENSAAINQVMANIFQIKFRLQHIRSLRRVLILRDKRLKEWPVLRPKEKF